MRKSTFDALTRWSIATVLRRRSLVTLGAAAVTAAAARPPAVAAATCGDKVRRVKAKCRRIREGTCLRQRTQCVDVANAFCNGDLGCIAATQPCCRLFDERCSASAAVQCLLAVN